MIFKFSPMITLDCNNVKTFFILDLLVISNEHMICFVLRSKEEGPYKSSEIINNDQGLSFATQAQGLSGSK